jgi:hypothetical protein
VENVEHSGDTADVGRGCQGTSPVHRRSNATMRSFATRKVTQMTRDYSCTLNAVFIRIDMVR